MAQVNIGAIKFNWKGPYNNGTAYVVDDVVSSGGSSYVCILASQGNAVSNGTYWQIMSSAGTNGNDADLLNIGSTAQGDLYYNSGSAIARLAAGTSGQFLKTQGASANPVWGDAGGGVLQIKRSTRTSVGTFNSPSSYSDFGVSVAITPTANNSSFWINAVGYASPSNHDTPWKFNISDSQVGATTAIFTDASRNHSHMGSTSHFGVGSFGGINSPDDYWLPQKTVGGIYTPSSNNGNARTFTLICRHSSNGTLHINQTQTNSSGQSSGGVSTIEVWEIANGIYS